MVFKHYTVMKFYIITVQIVKLLSGKYGICIKHLMHFNASMYFTIICFT